MKKFILFIFGVSVLGACLIYPALVKSVDSNFIEGSVICFGDSITEGYRLKKTSSYPYFLGLLLGETVINEGISGEISEKALLRIKKDVLDKNPRLVIVQFGGNDPYKKISHSATLANNDLIIEKIINAGAEAVLLIGESNMLQSKYLDGFREIAKRRNVLLIENSINEIIKDPTLRLDDVHPNARGYKIMAQHIYEALQPIL